MFKFFNVPRQNSVQICIIAQDELRLGSTTDSDGFCHRQPPNFLFDKLPVRTHTHTQKKKSMQVHRSFKGLRTPTTLTWAEEGIGTGHWAGLTWNTPTQDPQKRTHYPGILSRNITLTDVNNAFLVQCSGTQQVLHLLKPLPRLTCLIIISKLSFTAVSTPLHPSP